MNSRAQPWSEDEVRLAVDAYLDMLALELRGEAFVKSAIRRAALPKLRDRSDGSWERKLQNVSAVAIALGCPYVDGYKPLGNYQQLLAETFEQRLAEHQELQRELLRTATEAPGGAGQIAERGLPLEAPPPATQGPPLTQQPTFRPTGQRNYLELEARNRALGTAGEQLVVHLERSRLEDAAKWSLAKKVEHVAATQGDGLGYDVHSFEFDGRDRLLEVKTTRYGAFTPFFASRNEVARSQQDRDAYHLVRLYDFDRSCRYFTRSGAIDEQFMARPSEWELRP